MLQTFLTITLSTLISALVSAVFFATTLNAASSAKTPPTLEEINAHLLAEKAKNAPFDESKIKIDLESLGLDDLEPAPHAVKEKTIIPRRSLPKGIAPAPKDINITPKKSKAEIAEVKGRSKDSKKEGKGVISKIQNFLHKTSDKVESVMNKEEKKPENKATKLSNKQLEAIKKRDLKRRLEEKREADKHERIRREKSIKLNKLRKKYLIKIGKKKVSEYSDELPKIVPKPKQINKFLVYKNPAPPILDRYRTSDNVHIPIELTRFEKIDSLFNSINSDDISYFKSNYNRILESNLKNRSGDTILTYAILTQKHGIVASILSLGADPNMPNNLGYTPLEIAVELRDSKSLNLLIAHNVDVKYMDAPGRTYLMHAARVGFLEAADVFISKGVDVNAMDEDGFTALSIAYKQKNNVIVKFLLKHGAETWIEKPYDSSTQSLIKELNYRWSN